MKTPATSKTLSAIFCLAMALALRLNAQSFLTNGLVAYYPFSGDADDATGNGLDGVVLGAVLTTNQLGASNAAYGFAPQASVIVPSSPAINLFEQFSVTGWFFPTNTVQSAFQSLVNNGNGSENGTQWAIGLSGTYLVFRIGNGEGFMEFDPTNACQSNGWQHFAVTYDSPNNRVTVYHNGTNWVNTLPYYQVQSSAGKGFPLVIGNESGLNAGFHGSIDDVRIYNRPLSSNEVQKLYAYESPPPIVTLIEAVEPSFADLVVGVSYQLQVSSDLISWTNEGSAFTATNASMVYPQFFEVTNWNKPFFRLETAP